MLLRLLLLLLLHLLLLPLRLLLLLLNVVPRECGVVLVAPPLVAGGLPLLRLLMFVKLPHVVRLLLRLLHRLHAHRPLAV